MMAMTTSSSTKVNPVRWMGLVIDRSPVGRGQGLAVNWRTRGSLGPGVTVALSFEVLGSP